jgi:hypothetical protein
LRSSLTDEPARLDLERKRQMQDSKGGDRFVSGIVILIVLALLAGLVYWLR